VSKSKTLRLLPYIGESGEAGSGSAGVSEFDEDGGEKAVETPIEKPTE